jgi:beta-glucanase (GH16 family)
MRNRHLLLLLLLSTFFVSCTPISLPWLDEEANNSSSTVLTLTAPELRVTAGQTVSLSTRFEAVPQDKDYAVFIHFINSAGIQQSSFNGDYIPDPGTTTWKGSINYSKQVLIPEGTLPGVYKILIGFYDQESPLTRVALKPGPGVKDEGGLRYHVGSLIVSAPTTAPTPVSPPTSVEGPAGQDASQYTLTFSEEFSGSALDSSRWNDTIWYEKSNPTKNYKVSNGSLKIWPQRDANGSFFNRTIDTDGKYYQTYGYFEMEAKLPKGKGVWPAFWIFNHIGDRRPEIDIMEAYPGAPQNTGWNDADLNPTAFAATIWPNGPNNPSGGHKVLQTPDLSKGFHKYAVLWEPHKLTFFFDGYAFYESDITMADPMYIILDLWFGSASGQPDHTTLTGESNSFEVRYVRAWQKK